MQWNINWNKLEVLSKKSKIKIKVYKNKGPTISREATKNTCKMENLQEMTDSNFNLLIYLILSKENFKKTCKWEQIPIELTNKSISTNLQKGKQIWYNTVYGYILKKSTKAYVLEES